MKNKKMNNLSERLFGYSRIIHDSCSLRKQRHFRGTVKWPPDRAMHDPETHSLSIDQCDDTTLRRIKFNLINNLNQTPKPNY